MGCPPEVLLSTSQLWGFSMPLPPQTPGMPPCEGLRFGNPAWVTWGNVNLGFTGSVGCYSKLGCHFSSKFSYLYHPGIINHGFFIRARTNRSKNGHSELNNHISTFQGRSSTPSRSQWWSRAYLERLTLLPPNILKKGTPYYAQNLQFFGSRNLLRCAVKGDNWSGITGITPWSQMIKVSSSFIGQSGVHERLIEMWTSSDGFKPLHSTLHLKLNFCQLLSSLQRSLNQTCQVGKPECVKQTVANLHTEGTWDMILVTSIQNLHAGSTVLWMFLFYLHKPPHILTKQLRRRIDFHMLNQDDVLIQAMHGT